MKRLLYIAPLAAFAVLAYFLFNSLGAPPPDQLPSALIGKPAPRFVLPRLDTESIGFTRSDLAAGHVTVLNVWASWCAPCRLEAPILERFKRMAGVRLYGLAYKDKAGNARQFLNETGTPFDRIDLDRDGRVAIEWGVYDVPETFIIDGNGIVRLRYSGPITSDTLDQVFVPAIEGARKLGV